MNNLDTLTALYESGQWLFPRVSKDHTITVFEADINAFCIPDLLQYAFIRQEYELEKPRYCISLHCDGYPGIYQYTTRGHAHGWHTYLIAQGFQEARDQYGDVCLRRDASLSFPEELGYKPVNDEN